jgi:hypothetical protein
MAETTLTEINMRRMAWEMAGVVQRENTGDATIWDTPVGVIVVTTEEEMTQGKSAHAILKDKLIANGFNEKAVR